MKKKFAFLFVLSLCLIGCNTNKSNDTSSNPSDSGTPTSSAEHEHTFIDHPAVKPTCTHEGNIAYAECSTCGKFFTFDYIEEIEEGSYIIPKIPHKYVDHDAVEATCTHAGNIAYAECSVCGTYFSADHSHEIEEGSYIIPMAEHHFVDHPYAAPTCTQDGNTPYSECTSCGKYFSFDHSEEIQAGSYIIPKIPHTFVDHPATEATCEHAGNIAYASCETCDKHFDISHEHEITDDSYIIPKLDHDFTHYNAVPFNHIEYWECSICHNMYSDEEGENLVTDLTYYDTHNIWKDNVKNYLSANTEAEQIEALQHGGPTLNDQVKKKLTWANKGTAPYHVEVSMTETFDSYKTYTSSTNSLTLPGTLIPGQRYYYRVLDANDDVIYTLGGFEVDDTYCVRTLEVAGLFNVRDIGGWTAKDGNKVLYNKLIRGGRLTTLTNSGKETLLGELGVKTEIDLRAGSGGSREVVDDRLAYHQIGLNQYTMLVPGYVSPAIEGKPTETHYTFDTSTPLALKEIFETLADENNYPMYYHCNAGADRTGTLTFFINGLLGVSYEDLTKDFELTTFSSQGNRWRSGVSNGHFVTEGDMAGIAQADTNNYVAWGKLHDLITTNYDYGNGQLCSSIELYLKTVCGVSDETIAAVRRNLLGKDVDFDPVIVVEDTTFTMANGNLTLANEISYETGTFFGKECHKFYTTGTTRDHYIYNNLNLILSDKYSTFHFEIYIPSTNPKWNVDTGDYFLFAYKPNGGSTSYFNFSNSYDSTTGTKRHINLDDWTTIELDISSYTGSDLVRWAFYLPYGTAERPVTAYIANIYVE